jgi:hypothetical protein
MEHNILAKSGTEQPCFPFTGVSFDLGDPSNLLEYFEFRTSENVEIIGREINW